MEWARWGGICAMCASGMKVQERERGQCVKVRTWRSKGEDQSERFVFQDRGSCWCAQRWVKGQ